MSPVLAFLNNPTVWTLVAFIVPLTISAVKFNARQENEHAELKAALTDMADKLDRDKGRLDTIEETLYHVLSATVELGANGEVKKYRDKIASSGRW